MNDNRGLGGELRELALLFARLGATAFGGPLAHIAMMEDEVVTRRKWLDRQHFLDLIGATNLIPGPNSTEVAIHIGALRAGWPGLIVAGTCFILPAMLIVLCLAWLYKEYGYTPQASSILYGVKPVVMAIVAQALWKLAQTAIKGAFTVAITVAAIGGILLGVSEIVILAVAALIGLVIGFIRHRGTDDKGQSAGDITAETSPSPNDAMQDEAEAVSRRAPLLLLTLAPAASASPTLLTLFLVFLKIGSILYGSGYVLIAFLRADFVQRTGWLTDRQLLDAVAMGQITPGPVSTTATFIGYQLAGVPGALVATLGIFLPSFCFVGLLFVLMDRIRNSPPLRHFLDAVNAASLALMAVVTVQLMLPSLPDIFTRVVALVSLVILARTKLNSVWLVAAGAGLGLTINTLQSGRPPWG